jgi:uncharacterized protein YuzE
MEALKLQERQSNLNWDYDAEADVLYISIGEPRVAEGIDIGEGIIVRVSPQNNEVVGLTIIGLSKRVMEKMKER